MSARLGVIRQIAGTRYWLCPACGQKMGAVYADRVIVKMGQRELRMPVANQPEQDCIRCGASSRLEVIDGRNP